MTQYLSPLFGEFSTDLAIARSASQRAGIIAKPTFTSPSTGAGATLRRSLVLGADPLLGFFAWKTHWDKQNGSFTVLEDTPVTFASNLQEPPAGQGRHYLLIGRWKWIAGPVGGDGIALGVFTAAQHAVYDAIAGIDSVSPVDPGVPATDAAGRRAVVLARVVWMAGSEPVVEWLPDTMLDLAEIGTDLSRKHNRTGDERHIGKFKVTEAPTDEEDVVRMGDVKEGTAKPYANISQFASNIGTAQYPIAGGVPVRLGTVRSSGVNVEALTTGGWRAKVKGIYRIDYVVKQWGSPGGGAYQWAALGVKTATNPGAGFIPQVNERSFFRNGTAEAFQQLTWTLDLEENDIIGLFTVSEAPSIGFVYATIENLGERAATDPLTINTGNQTWMAANGQVYPKIVTFPMSAANAVGAVTWSIQGGTAQAFAAVVGNVVTVTFAGLGAFTLNMRALDASGNIADKTISVTLTAFEVIPLVITTTNKAFEVDAYPYVTSILLTSTGGELPITWAIVAGANTTIPAPTIVSGRLVSSLPNAGSWTVEVKATDSAGTPQVVTKVLTVTAEDYIEPPPDDPCFEEDTTWILMADRSAKLMKDVVAGDTVACVNEFGHLKGHTTIRPGLVTDKTRVPGTPEDPAGVLVDGVHATPGHAYAVPGEFRRADTLKTGDTVMEPDGDRVVPATVGEVKQAPALRVRGNLGVQGGTYFVGATKEGPFRLVHNVQMCYW